MRGRRTAIGAAVDLSQRSGWEHRFWLKVQKGNGCWLWSGYRTPFGHGTFTIRKGAVRYAHRVAYALHSGADLAGVVVCHRCDMPSCVNPDHLYVGTMADNARDMVERGRISRSRSLLTHCKNGHELTPENVYVGRVARSRSRYGNHLPWRKCRVCARDRKRAADAAYRAANPLPERTACAKGHPYTDENTRWMVHHGYSVRVCKTCERARGAAYRERRRAS